MGYDFLIFDLDGTIVDSQRDITSAINAVRKDFGFKPLSIEKVRSFLGSGVKALVDKAVPDSNGEILSAALEKFKLHYFDCLTDTTVIYKGIEEMLNVLQDKKKAILSNKMEVFSYEIIKRLGLSKYFTQVWGGDTVGVKKPDPKPILDLIKKNGADLQKTIMIGDSANDIKAAKAAGIDSLAVLYGYDSGQIKEYQPDYTAETPGDIIKFVL
ncbi:MAG: HAD-IA family hydrolase [Endomicrobium sp.]|jgi:phosphoglycolate phosphatase|nr:HAD-IA family hydrolase [Endomicrobium sp.]